MLRNSTEAWGWPARAMHWLMALLILAQVGLGKYAHELERSPRQLDLLMWHKSIGITLLGLALLRLGWVLLNPAPKPPAGSGRWAQRAARAGHAALYALMFAVPLSGWLYNSAKNVPFRLFRTVPWPDLIEPDQRLAHLFEEWHEGLVSALLAVLIVHVSAALWHEYVRRDGVLRRMLRGSATG